MPSPIRLIRLHWSLLLALAVALATGFLTPSDWRWPTRAALGWDTGIGLFLVIFLVKVLRTHSTDQIRDRASDLDDAGGAVLPLSLLAAIASIGIVIGETATAPEQQAATTAALVLTTVALSWTFVHMMFAQHYAHGYYSQSDATEASPAKGKSAAAKTSKAKDNGGLLFSGEDEPDYWDFIHFAVIIGVANQTADVQIADRRLRRIASLHSVLAFVFNTVIVALGVNFAVSLLGN